MYQISVKVGKSIAFKCWVELDSELVKPHSFLLKDSPTRKQGQPILYVLWIDSPLARDLAKGLPSLVSVFLSVPF